METPGSTLMTRHCKIVRLRRAAPRLALVALVVALSPASVRADDPTIAGHWHGHIATPTKPLEMNVDFSAAKDGAWQGEISIPAQGAKDLPLAKIEAVAADVSFLIMDVPGNPVFKGKLEDQGKKLKGTFTQGGISFPFQLERGPGPVALARQSLEGYDSFVSKAIMDWEVPGLAIAIVKNGEVILAGGFGMRDVAGKLPVTARTLFPIGSCTKAFTTFVMGTLVDLGKLEWDKPVRSYAPEIQLFDRAASDLLSARDLVTHRSGLPRHDLVWYNATLSRKEIVRRLPFLEPSEAIRSKFQYNNIMFMTAGYLVDSLTGMPWEDAVRKRIFEPLLMTDSNFSVKDSQKTADFAKPYDDRDDRVVEIPFRDITNVGPAGSINSSVTDMARWLIVNSQKGKYAGRQILSPRVLAEIQTPHMTTGAPQERPEIGPAGYGLGWGVDDYRGHRRVVHGGGIDGFSAMTTVFPHDAVGIVVLSNMDGTQLPEMLSRHAADRILSLPAIDWSSEYLKKKKAAKEAAKSAKSKKTTVRRSGTSPAHPLHEYAGDYEHRGYGVAQVEERDGKLLFRYNGLEAELEHWHFEFWNALKNPRDPALEDMKVQFLTGLSGFVEGLSVPFEPRVKPIVFSRKPDAKLSDPDYLKKFTGEYVLAGNTLSIRLKGNVLVLDSPGQSSLTLLPDRQDAFKLKEQSGTSIRFVTAGDGKVSEMAMSTAAGVFSARRKNP
jgi:CubicO group peptidase (beta-lactamase class C family)